MSIPQSFYDEWKPKVGDKVMNIANGKNSVVKSIYTVDEGYLVTDPVIKVDFEDGLTVYYGDLKYNHLPINVDIPWESCENSVCPVPNGPLIIRNYTTRYNADGPFNATSCIWSPDKYCDGIKSFRILPPEQEENMPGTQEESSNNKFIYAGKKRSFFEILSILREKDEELIHLKSELAKHKPDPFAPPFEDGNGIYMVTQEGYVIEGTWTYSNPFFLHSYLQGRVFTTREKAEEFARVEQTRFKLEVLAASSTHEGKPDGSVFYIARHEHNPSRIYVNGVYVSYAGGIGFKSYKDAQESINLIGEEAIREFLEWKR